MCTAECKEKLATKIGLLLESLRQEAYRNELTKCLYNCLLALYKKLAVISYNKYSTDEIQLLSDYAFTDAIVAFHKKNAEGKIYDNGVQFKTIFFQFFHFCLLNQIKKNKKRLENESPFTDKVEKNIDTEQAGLFQDNHPQYNLVQQAMSKLEEADRQIIEWRYIDGLSIDEIVQILDIKTRTVSDRLYSATIKLKKLIGK